MPTRWKALLAPVGAPTGDGRRFQVGALTHRDLPLALRWQREDGAGHEDAVTVGRIEAIDIGDTEIRGRGVLFDDADPETMPRLAEDVAEVKMLLGHRDGEDDADSVLGISVDLDEFDAIPVEAGTDVPLWDRDRDEIDEDTEIELLVTSGRVSAGTLVPIAAFAETAGEFELLTDDDGSDDDADMPALVASVIGSTDLPIADTSRDWDGDAASRRMVEAGADVARRGHLFRDPDGDPDTQAAYKLPYADLIDGTLTIVPRGVAAAAGGRGVNRADIPADQKATIRRKICTLYGKIRSRHEDWPECPFQRDSSASETDVAALVASVAAPELPSADLFTDPELDRPTPVSFGDDGRIVGHIALHNQCHAGFEDVCITPPSSNSSDYAWFNRYPVDTDAGIVWAGRLTAGGNHAELHKSLTAAIATYDSKVTAGYVRAGSDEHGIWISGALASDLDEATRAILARRKLSGDWRETPQGLELVELLALSPSANKALSEPGFPVAAHMSGGRQTALVACLGPTSDQTSTAPLKIDYALLGRETARALREQEITERRRTELAAAIDEAAVEERERHRAALADLVDA